MHRSASAHLDDLAWRKRRWESAQAYAESKLHDVLLAFGVARRWPEVLSNALEPGWVATRMGGPSAPDDIDQAHRTQVWLAVSDDPAARVTGKYFYHMRPRTPNPQDRICRTSSSRHVESFPVLHFAPDPFPTEPPRPPVRLRWFNRSHKLRRIFAVCHATQRRRPLARTLGQVDVHRARSAMNPFTVAFRPHHARVNPGNLPVRGLPRLPLFSRRWAWSCQPPRKHS